jgi:hypothetical protein
VNDTIGQALRPLYRRLIKLRFEHFCLLLLALILLSVIGVVGLTVTTLPTPKVTRNNCEKIRRG